MKLLLLSLFISITSQNTYAYDLICQNENQQINFQIQNIDKAFPIAFLEVYNGTRVNSSNYYLIHSKNHKKKILNYAHADVQIDTYFVNLEKLKLKNNKQLAVGLQLAEKFQFITSSTFDLKPRGTVTTQYHLNFNEKKYHIHCKHTN